LRTKRAARRERNLAPAGQAIPRGLRVLVVDDSVMIRDIAAAHIRAAGHEATCVAGGARALAAAREKKFDVIIMDLNMPDMDGLEAARLIRALPRGRGDVRIIAFTVQISAEQSIASQMAGMSGYLAKPFTKAALLTVLEEAMQGTPAAARPDAPNEDEALPVLDEAMFQANTGLLKPASIKVYLENFIAAANAALIVVKSAANRFVPDDDFLESIHKLSGNAGMCGFVRLATITRGFVRAANGAARHHAVPVDRLAAALEASLQGAKYRLASMETNRGETNRGETNRGETNRGETDQGGTLSHWQTPSAADIVSMTLARQVRNGKSGRHQPIAFEPSLSQHGAATSIRPA
jgi:CheY-like chemotaxis protein